jgi:hypothetical protein
MEINDRPNDPLAHLRQGIRLPPVEDQGLVQYEALKRHAETRVQIRAHMIHDGLFIGALDMCGGECGSFVHFALISFDIV